ncbi:hypothetical protein KAU32_07600 [bacterium]|nr:hypothetical protein [bacterium]
MKRSIIFSLVLVMLFTLMLSCGGGKKADDDVKPRTGRTQKVEVEDVPQEETLEGESKYVYEPRSRRDPFKPVLNFKSKIDIEKIKLVGFVKNSKKNIKAIVEDETGNSYYLSEGDFLGEAKVVSLDLNERKLIFEIQKDYYVIKKTLRLEE